MGYEASLDKFKAIKPLCIRPPFRNTACMAYLNALYYSGFSYVMLQQYFDAVVCFKTLIVYTAQIKLQSLHSEQAYTAHMDQIQKRNEQVYALLAIIVALVPQVQKYLKKSILINIHDKYGKKFSQNQLENETIFEELFSISCPKFVTTSTTDNSYYKTKNFWSQLRYFLLGVKKYMCTPAFKRYLSIYTRISIKKPDNFIKEDAENLKTIVMEHVYLKSESVIGKSNVDTCILIGKDISSESEAIEIINIAKETYIKQEQYNTLICHIERLDDMLIKLSTLLF